MDQSKYMKVKRCATNYGLLVIHNEEYVLQPSLVSVKHFMEYHLQQESKSLFQAYLRLYLNFIDPSNQRP
jgi:hypothetical protein